MPFKYACFVSYRHVRQELGRQFVANLLEALKSHIELELDDEIDVFIDQERLQGGIMFNKAFADAICKSVCMIVIFTPKYFSKTNPYCTKEYLAMKQLEQERLKSMGDRKRGLIIPIVLKGSDSLPLEIKAERQYYDFSRYSLVAPDILKHEEFNSYVAEIARYIRETHAIMAGMEDDLNDLCEQFEMPQDQLVSEWLDSLIPPKQVLPR